MEVASANVRKASSGGVGIHFFTVQPVEKCRDTCHRLFENTFVGFICDVTASQNVDVV